jgi:Asp-tRNA(Asn)/Glu-tRNA(Gln) amidotransferase A subunit family amidase
MAAEPATANTFVPAAALSAAEAAKRIREGLLTSQELVDACLERIAQVDDKVQAWAFLDEKHARAQARAADEKKALGTAIGPLHGVPVGLKDIIDTADMPTENGTVLHKGRTPRQDAAVVTMLRAAGAVILGKTVTTECAYFHPGKTRNPHNPEHTPGGSSSGSAAAVGASMVPLALGSQTNGSVIRPAAFCGVYGFKPTHGLVPRTGILALSRTLDHVGFFARSIDDLALLAETLTGFDEGDPDTVPRARTPFRAIAGEEPPVEPMFALIKTPHWERADADMKDAFAELQATLGERVEEVPLMPSAGAAWEWHTTIMETEMAASFEREYEAGRKKLSEKLRSLIERGREVRAVDYLRAKRTIAPLVATFDELFMQRYDAILTPAAPGTAPKGLKSTGDPAFCSLWTLLGLPTITLPLMQGENGLPLGVQLVGRKNFDARLMRTARWLEKRVSA